MRGKYSPTVSAAYMWTPNWFEHYSQGERYDPDGFDSYGYDDDDVDRAGNHELDYAMGQTINGEYVDVNDAYEQVLDDWGFDGNKPILQINNKWIDRADEMMKVNGPVDAPAVICGDHKPSKKKKRETAAERRAREAEERAVHEAELATMYPHELMSMLERAQNVNFELTVSGGKFRLSDRDDRGDGFVELTLDYNEDNQEALRTLDWRLDFKEAAEREIQRKIQLKQSALAKLSSEELEALLGK